MIRSSLTATPVRRARSGPGSSALALVAAIVVAAVVAACGSAGASPSGSDGRIRVVATTTVFADLVRNVGGDRVTVESLVPAGAEPHTFAPSPSDVRRVSEADVIVMNGLGLDDWLRPLAEEAKRQDAVLLELGTDLEGVTYLAEGEEGSGAAPTTAVPGEPANPHLWLNVAYAQKYVDRIADALADARPADAEAIRASAATYRAALGDLDASIRDRISSLPEDHRRIVSFHDAFPYYAAAYDLDIVGVVVPVPGQEPSASDVVAVVDAIRAAGATAIFAEAQFSPKVADQIAAETGATVVATLYNDSLGDPPADSYAGMMGWDTDQVVEALR
ncbi:MAG: metal ABC transporter substrate-binding protein [Chloroflexi bacterium]|nr:metal ABC transporter substrate-binding protein [Chloroflexota bacterium]